MGATKTTFSLTVTRLTGDTINGFWWAAKDSSNRMLKINYADASAVVDNASDMVFADTFWEMMVAIDGAGISLPLVEVNINVEEVSEANTLQAQFEPPLLTNAQISLIAADYNVVDLCQLMGAMRLVDRFYLQGHLTLQQLSNIYIYLGINNKTTKDKVMVRVNWLVANNHITQAQADAFEVQWDNQVG